MPILYAINLYLDIQEIRSSMHPKYPPDLDTNDLYSKRFVVGTRLDGLCVLIIELLPIICGMVIFRSFRMRCNAPYQLMCMTKKYVMNERRT